MAPDKATFYAGAGGDGGQGVCKFCGNDLSSAQSATSGICGRPECHERMIQEAGQAILDRKRANHREVTAEVLAKVPQALVQANARLGGGDATIASCQLRTTPSNPCHPNG